MLQNIITVLLYYVIGQALLFYRYEILTLLSISWVLMILEVHFDAFLVPDTKYNLFLKVT